MLVFNHGQVYRCSFTRWRNTGFTQLLLRNVELMNQGRAVENLGFSSSISSENFSKFERPTCHLPMADKSFRFQVEMRKSESPVSLGTNGRATKMVPTSEIVKNRTPPTKKVEIVNGSSRVVNGASIVKRDTASALEVLQKISSLLFSLIKFFLIQKNRRHKTASWLRECVLQLGPTFIKLGQLSSTRSDLFPREFVDELAKLQVHRAVLHNGEKVVVKVQRPGLKKLFDIDLRNLKLIAEYFQRSETFGGPTRDWIGIYEECATSAGNILSRRCCPDLYQEIDYINEGKNADRFRRDFRNVKWVRVPLVFWDYTATKVLTLEYVPGFSLTHDFKGYRIDFIVVILKTGFFHADPHPGNLAIDVDEAIIYYDFGYAKSYRFLKHCNPRETCHRIENNPSTMNAYVANCYLGFVCYSHRSAIPFSIYLTFVLRAFSTLEGIGYSLDPDFSFVKIAAPYAQELLDTRQQQRSGPQLVQEIRKQADDARTYTMSMPYSVQRIEEIVKQLESGDLKLRVRVLESERAARKATILQMATMYTVLGGTLLNLGVTLGNQGSQVIANGSYVGAGKLFLTPKTFTLKYFFLLPLDIFKFAFINFPVAEISGFIKMQAFS
ncbi:Protein activity of BC1 complex kinase 7, chloroplastic [Vitis vinifera]|uniref:Protein activity of BC1 complex kinase 7, chloroplastic n=1 Tax=Vitis vinifera TaxID=29760 RepID=A0A438JH85_VITVI|nr:Protein activity of BC1 complex kinase 7, chloroplastic [Vitis vinifera]